MLSVDNIAGLLDALSLQKKDLSTEEFVQQITNHVQAEPKVLRTLYPKLLEQVIFFI